MVYLDYNATSPTDEAVLERMLPYFSTRFGNNASRDHAWGWAADDAVEEARHEVATLVNAHTAEIVFTSSATESINLALRAFVEGGRPVLTSSAEHDSVLAACRLAGTRGRSRAVYVGTCPDGHVDLDDYRRQVESTRPCVAVLLLANNEIGTIQPIREAAAIAHAAGALFMCDATQAVGKVPVDVQRDGIDLAAFSAHKIYGPKGVGALFVRAGAPRVELTPLIPGPQEHGLRGGTVNVPGVVGFGEACRIAASGMTAEVPRIGALRDRLEDGITSEVPDGWVNGDRSHRLCNTSNMGFGGVDARTLIRDMHDVAVSTRSACSSGAAGPSHVLKAIGLTDEQASSCIRFSLGRFTTQDEIDYTIGKVATSVHKLRRSKSARV
jgi:cysteine desulfurase